MISDLGCTDALGYGFRRLVTAASGPTSQISQASVLLVIEWRCFLAVICWPVGGWGAGGRGGGGWRPKSLRTSGIQAEATSRLDMT